MCGYPGRCKDFFGSFEREIGCGHVSGLCSSDHLMPRAGMAMRRSGPNQWRGREALWECLVFLTSILPICLSLLSNVLLTPSRVPVSALGRDRHTPIFFTSCHHCSDRPRCLIRKCNGNEQSWLALQHVLKPRSVGRSIFDRPSDAGHRTNDQQPPDIPLSHFRCSTQFLASACRFLERHKSQPGCKITPAAKAVHIRYRGFSPPIFWPPTCRSSRPLQMTFRRLEAEEIRSGNGSCTLP